METVRIRRSGYPVRRAFQDFVFHYGVLGRELGGGMDNKEKSVAILGLHDSQNKDWQLGKTKVRWEGERESGKEGGSGGRGGGEKK